ncbi:hypothetical protein CEK25_010430 [Fusarium fujikuroi]|nr:hypothetical protein CEK25_010430 [Fusarium fujikuroi]
MNKSCVALTAGTPEVAAPLTACDVGEDASHPRVSSATAEDILPIRGSCPSRTLPQVAPAETGIPGGCNPAHPGSCPSSYFTKTYTAPAETFTSISGIPGGCNPAHPGSCPSSYFTKTYTAPAETVASKTGIPGGCNPAPPAPTECSEGTNPEGTGSAVPLTPEPKPVEGCIKDLTREGNGSAIITSKSPVPTEGERCTIKAKTRHRNLGNEPYAGKETWFGVPDVNGQKVTVSWGYLTPSAPDSLVISLVPNKVYTYFGFTHEDGQNITTTGSDPFESGQYDTPAH